MIIELINTGSELMLGAVLNTHAQWIARQLTALGHTLARQTSIADDAQTIHGTLSEALTRADLILVTGGLGPTGDDLTRPLIAQLAGAELSEDPALLQHIEQFFTARKRPMPPQTRVQALVPRGAQVLPNPNGTAPGLLIEIPAGRFRPAASVVILLPGPPRELHPMFQTCVVPLLRDRFPPPNPFLSRTFKTTGLGESIIEEKIAAPLQHLTAEGLDIGYCARMGEVDLRLAARGPHAAELLSAAEKIVRELIGRSIFGADTDSLEAVIVQLLAQRASTLAIAESCTGGLVSHRITNVPGASKVLLCSWVTYSNEAKHSLLGVNLDTLQREGAVSESAARQMAEGARMRAGATYALAITGIAGPSGGSETKPLGTVFIALASPEPTLCLHERNPFDRETFKQITSQQALEMLRRKLLAGF